MKSCLLTNDLPISKTVIKILNSQKNIPADLGPTGIRHGVKLIVDGGVENNNNAVEEYINSEEVTVQKLIAGKDIKFSNSIVEAQNKIIKYRYLFKHDFKDINELRNLLDWIITDYQFKRPHHSLKGLTPYEALTGIPLPKEQWSQQIQVV